MFRVLWYKEGLSHLEGESFDVLVDAIEFARDLSWVHSGFFKVQDVNEKVFATTCHGGVVEGDEEFDEL
jgi:hypothetical protein